MPTHRLTRAALVLAASAGASPCAAAAQSWDVHVAPELGVGSSYVGRYNPSSAEQVAIRAAAVVGVRWRDVLSLQASVAGTDGLRFGDWVTGIPGGDGLRITRVVVGRDPADGFLSTALRLGVEVRLGAR